MLDVMLAQQGVVHRWLGSGDFRAAYFCRRAGRKPAVVCDAAIRRGPPTIALTEQIGYTPLYVNPVHSPIRAAVQMTDSESGAAWRSVSRLSRVDGEGDATDVARPLRVLFVGRRTTAQALEAVVAALDPGPSIENGAEPSSTGALDLVTLTNQRTALEEIRAQPPKVVLVEVEVKRQSRARFVEMVRYRLPTAVIFAVSVQPPPARTVFDGVLQLPLQMQEVQAAINSARDEFAGHVIQRGPIRLNVATRTVFAPNGQRHMTPKQCALLQFFLARANQVISRKDIMENIWETDYLEDTRTLDVHIRWLRECIEPDPSNPVYLLTERGKGYHLRLP